MSGSFQRTPLGTFVSQINHPAADMKMSTFSNKTLEEAESKKLSNCFPMKA